MINRFSPHLVSYPLLNLLNYQIKPVSYTHLKLVGMGIDPKQLASLLQSQNQIINTGEIRAGEQQLRVTANGMYTTVDDIRNQVITTKAGQVKLGDIAVIEKGYIDPPSNKMCIRDRFYTGKSTLVDTAGRVDKFMSRYGDRKKK